MIQAGRRGLNPLQTPTSHDFVPRHRDLGMTAKDVGGRQLARDVVLAGVDHFVVGRRRGNLRHVARLDGIAEYNTHRRISC